MRINDEMLRNFNTSFKALFNTGFKGATSIYTKIAMIVPSSGRGEAYGWLGELPEIREWLGDRHVHGLTKDGFKIDNREFEMTVRVRRTDLEDDTVGIYKPLFENMGRKAGEFPDKLVVELVESGFTQKCFDGQYFFDTDHPVERDGAVSSVSNYQAGAGDAWYLLDLSQSVKPFIYQERLPFKMDAMDDPNHPNVFMQNEFVYGVRGRSNAGFGLWQLAYASKAELNAENYEAARVAMSKMKGVNGQLLGLRGTTLLVPTQLEGRARKLLKNTTLEAGESNSWVDSAELIVSPWLV